MGSAVVLGHVDSDQGPAVFSLLRTLAPGDVVDVGTADGASESSGWSRCGPTPTRSSPHSGSTPPAGSAVNLVTCGGADHAARGGYQANVVVRARWIDEER